MSKFDKKLTEYFELVPTELELDLEETPTNLPAVITDIKQHADLEHDYEKVRDNYKDLIKVGKDAIDELHVIAKESEHPRAYEVLATLIKNTSDVSDKLIAIHKQIKDIKKEDSTIGKTINNIDKAIMFSGSTADLSKMLNDAKKKELKDGSS